MPDSDNKWTAKRGSQGDTWRWQVEPPPDPDAAHPATGSKTLFPARAEKPARRLPSLNPALAITSLASFLAAAAAVMTQPARQIWARATTRPSRSEPRDFTVFALVLAGFTFLASLALLIALVASLTGDDDSSGSVPPSEDPTPPTELTTSATPPPTATPTARAAPTPSSAVLTPPSPRGDVSLAFWANQLDAWWFGSVPEGAAVYHPGDQPPWLLRWNAQPGADYVVSVTYDCRAGETPLIDLLTGVEDADEAIFLAEWGRGSKWPEAAVPIPDTADSDIDDGAPGLLYLYGGKFKLLPEVPSPPGPCVGERTITMPVQATAGTVALMGSARLAHPGDHNGAGAADARNPIRLRIAVSGVGETSAALSPDVIKP